MSNMMHMFTLSSADVEYTRLPFKLDLGVGDEGIIGRRVKMVHQGADGQDVVRQGIIGWN